MRTHGKSRHVKKGKIYTSKYKRKYGYTIQEIADILGWSKSIVHTYLKVPHKRKEMLELVEIEKSL